MVTNRLTVPYGGAWIPGNLGGHWWQSDNALGVCRIDPAPAGVNPPFQTSTVANACSTVAKAGGQIIVTNPAPGFPGLPAGAKFMFVPDASSKSNAVVRFVIDPATETIKSSTTFTVTPPSNVGGGSNGARAVALALAPNGLDLYVGYIKSGDIMKITNATVNGNPTFAKVGSTSDGKGVNSMVMFNNDLYLAELGGTNPLSTIPDPSGLNRPACASAAPCNAVAPPAPKNPSVPIPGNIAGLATDGTSIYIGDSPLTGGQGSGIVQWNVAAGTTSIYSSEINPAYDAFDGVNTLKGNTAYLNPTGLGFDANGNLYVADDPSFRCAAPACPAAPTTQGHLWKVAAAPAAPTVTSISPTTGVPEGGTLVTINGTGFNPTSGATKVFFGGVAATGVTCSSTKLCTAVSPAGTATQDVSVSVGTLTSPLTAADKFAYQGITITGISPNSGPTAGGTIVTITGTGFGTDVSLVTVNFGAAPVQPTTCSSTACTVTSPPGTGGPVTITVTVKTAAGTSDTSNSSTFGYVANTAPFVTSLCVVTDATNPTGPCAGTTGIAGGGTMVRLTGGNLSTITGFVNFGANPGTVVSCTAGTTCTVVSPPSPVGAGTVGVTFTVGSQTSVQVSFTYANPSATVWAFGITAPKGGMLWVPKDSGGGHWWSSDHTNGFCRQDPMSGGAPFAMNYGVCDDGSIGSPGQAVYDASVAPCQAGAAGPCHYIYVPDNAVKSTAVWRLTFDSATETIVGPPEGMLPLADVRTLKPNGMALGPNPSDPTKKSLYVTDLTEANIRRLDGPAGDPRLQTLTIIGTTGDGRGANGTIGFLGNKLYVSENRAASWLDITKCTDNSATPCSTATTSTSTGAGITGTVPLPTGVFVAGVATDPVHNLVYATDSPGGAAGTIYRYNAATNSAASVTYIQNGTAPSPGPSFNCAQTCTRPTDSFATSTNFSFVFGIVVDPNNGNLMITEDATAGNRSGRGRAWLSPFIP